MRIDHLVIKNYCCFESFELKLNPQFNLLVGDNASGKTSLLDAIHIAADSWLLGVDVPRRAPNIDDENVRLVAFEQNNRRYTFEKQYPVSIRASGVVMGEQVDWMRERVSDQSTTRYSGAEAILDIGRKTVASLRSGEKIVLPLISSYGTERLWIEPDRARRNGPASSTWNSERSTRLLGYRNIQFLIHEEALFDWLAKETFAALQEGSTSPALRVVTQAIVGCIEDAEDLYYDIRREDVVVWSACNAHTRRRYREESDTAQFRLEREGSRRDAGDCDRRRIRPALASKVAKARHSRPKENFSKDTIHRHDALATTHRGGGALGDDSSGRPRVAKHRTVFWNGLKLDPDSCDERRQTR